MYYPNNIKEILNEITGLIREYLDPDYILIAGSFGKGSWLFSKGELISDFEMVFVCENKWSLKKKKILLKRLNNKFPYEISLKGYLTANVKKRVLSNYSFENPGYLSLDFFDTFQKPIYLFNRHNELLNIAMSVDELPIWEAWRLYVNRMGDLLHLEYSIIDDELATKYYWLKIFESTADAYCIINKIYDKCISKRLLIFNIKLIEEDKELSDICKESFPLIQKSLKARNSHNLSLFDGDVNIDECKLIVNSWMNYFEKKLINHEKLLINTKIDFFSKYKNDKCLQNKYLGFNYKYNIFISNIIRLMNNFKLIGFEFKFYRFDYSWRHIILLCVSSLYYEKSLNSKYFSESNKIASKLINQKSINCLDNEGFFRMILDYWKILR